MESLRGHFLVGSPHLSDPNFYHSVVLMVQHDEEGALGLILNRPTASTVADVWRLIGHEESHCKRAIYLGGPVSGPIMALHNQRNCSQIDVADGVYFTTEREHLEEIVADEDRPWLLFSGYSGWGAGQLERELKVGGWLIVPAREEDVFYTGEDLWERLIKQIGQEIIAPAIRSAAVPPDPSMN